MVAFVVRAGRVLVGLRVRVDADRFVTRAVVLPEGIAVRVPPWVVEVPTAGTDMWSVPAVDCRLDTAEAGVQVTTVRWTQPPAVQSRTAASAAASHFQSWQSCGTGTALPSHRIGSYFSGF